MSGGAFGANADFSLMSAGGAFGGQRSTSCCNIISCGGGAFGGCCGGGSFATAGGGCGMNAGQPGRTWGNGSTPSSLGCGTYDPSDQVLGYVTSTLERAERVDGH